MSKKHNATEQETQMNEINAEASSTEQVQPEQPEGNQITTENAVANANNDVEAGKNERQEAQKKAEKKLHGRKRLFADYQYKDVKSKNGKTVRRKMYTGDHFGYAIPGEYKKNEKGFINRIKLFYSGAWVLLCALWIMASTTINPMGLGSGGVKEFTGQHFYVLLPYLVCALPLMLTLMTIVEFVFTRGNRHERAFAEALSQNMKGQTITEMIAAGLCMVCETIFIILNYNEIVSIIDEIFLILYMAGMIAVCLFWLKLQDSLRIEKKK